MARSNTTKLSSATSNWRLSEADWSTAVRKNTKWGLYRPKFIVLTLHLGVLSFLINKQNGFEQIISKFPKSQKITKICDSALER